MSIASIVCEGFGPGASIARVVLAGFVLDPVVPPEAVVPSPIVSTQDIEARTRPMTLAGRFGVAREPRGGFGGEDRGGGFAPGSEPRGGFKGK